MSIDKHPKVREIWIYRQSLRPYVVLQVKDGDVLYTTFVMSPAFGKVFRRTISDFMEAFKPPEMINSADVEAAIDNTLTFFGIH